MVQQSKESIEKAESQWKTVGTHTENAFVQCCSETFEQKAVVQPKHVLKAREHSLVKAEHGKNKCMKLQFLSR